MIGEEIPGAVARQEEAMEAQHENSRQAGCGVPVEVFYSSPQSIDVEKALRQARHRGCAVERSVRIQRDSRLRG